MAKITGNNANNFLMGTQSADFILSFGGNDTILGQGGNDIITGGSGNDKLLGDVGDDTILGGGNNDSLFGGQGNDKLFGGTGNDILDGFGINITSDQVDEATGGNGADVFVLGKAGFGAYYGGSGVQYMNIKDFNRLEGDKIQISGGIGEYTLNTNFPNGTGILKNNNLIAVVNDVTDLTAADFISV
ncbi:calcium-binding protein [Moorena sp. SIO4G3]|uniref:calcium-binding protein n=1 Tax=Moorena sp. SIO4G3 TaxID=2607821 RepID=UPI0025E272FC|nr:calcium-binding protein [Moorena sp. SIO4G3]